MADGHVGQYDCARSDHHIIANFHRIVICRVFLAICLDLSTVVSQDHAPYTNINTVANRDQVWTGGFDKRVRANEAIITYGDAARSVKPYSTGFSTWGKAGSDHECAVDDSAQNASATKYFHQKLPRESQR